MNDRDRLELAVKQFADVLTGAKHDTGGSPVTTGFAHGPGGLWSLAGQNQRVWSAMVGLKSLATALPSFASRTTNPIQSYLTGVQAYSGELPTTVCELGPTAGLTKTGAVTRTFGKYKFATPELNINSLGRVRDRADPMDLSLMNTPDQGGNIFPGFNGAANLRQSLDMEVKKRFFELQVTFARYLATQLYTGNPANNNPLLADPNQAAYAEFNGLQILVNTGYRDAVQGVAVPSLDSDVKDFGDQRINDAGTQAVTMLTAMWRYLTWKADSQGISGVDWAFVMRPGAFWALTDVWPCAYYTAGCTPAGTAQAFVDGTSMRNFTDEMRNRRFLMIDGVQVPVILDSYLPETQPVGSVFESTIYLLPLRAMGVPTLYWEYFDETNEDINAALNTLGVGPGVFTSDGGAYLVTTSRTGECIQWGAKTMPRLVLELPYLAGRLNNVRYYLLQHESDPNPASGYHQDGGSTSRSGPSLYTPVAA